ncbi:MAG: PadR family transcriptional regulator [Gammaproteobacteria bacterium]|nr:PadR family transcriptional regulator [Gammaproteobacteria bacterium]
MDRRPNRKTRSKTQFAVLGLLSWQPMSGYDIKKMITMGLSHFWAESYGQLYPTLERLVSDGLATKASESTGKRKRHVFSITDSGRQRFLAWLAGPTDQPRIRNEFQLKFFLASELPLDQGLSLLEDYRTQQQGIAEMYGRSELILTAALEKNDEVEEIRQVLGLTSRQQLLFFLISLRHGVLAVEARLAWCEESIRALKKERKAQENDDD